MTLFDDQDEPALTQITRTQLEGAYEQELTENPPFASIKGNEPQVVSARAKYARQDVARVYAAAARCGCAIQLVPLPQKKGGA